MPHPETVASRSPATTGDRHNYDVPATPAFSASFIIVIVSLLCVALFGGALIGGLLSGEPSSGFVLTIISASSAAIVVALIVVCRYYVYQKNQGDANGAPMKESDRVDIRATFTGSDEEDPVQFEHPNHPPHLYQTEEPPARQANQYAQDPPRFPERTPVGDRIREVKAQAMAPGDVSAMSPTTYDLESYTEADDYTRSVYQGNGYRLRQAHYHEQQETQRRGFDFASVASKSAAVRYQREDPPEDGVNGNSYIANEIVTKDPSAPIVTADGVMVEDGVSDVVLNSPDAYSSGRQTPSQKSSMMPPPPPKRSTASEAGSAVSSLFLKPFATMFGSKKQEASSEAGYSEASSFVRGSATGTQQPRRRSKKQGSGTEHEGKPPMPGRKSDDKRRGLNTIGGDVKEDRYVSTSEPSTPGNNSTFSIPPPRRVPSTPGSEAPSEYRSIAEDSNGVASSTFDPSAHERAVNRTRNNMAPLGANADMPVYYEEEEESVDVSAVDSKPGYDVFAPPGPIGIVVDTTEKGCIVHSLKKASPMHGLINPGDLIVALDDFDVRKMDAASLTRLMAKKSQQPERKFTLMPL